MCSNYSVGQLQSLKNKTGEVQIGFIKHLVTISAALLALLASLAQPTESNTLLYQSVLLLLLLSVLFGTATLYITLTQLRKMGIELAAILYEKAQTNLPSDKIVVSKWNMLFYICEGIAVLSFLAAAVCLLFFAAY